jgi:hypothetical protein
MLTPDPVWAAGYTTAFSYSRGSIPERFVGKVHVIDWQPRKPFNVGGNLHDVEKFMLSMARQAGWNGSGSLYDAASALAKTVGYDALVSRRDGGLINLVPIPVSGYQDPAEVVRAALRNGRDVPENLVAALDESEYVGDPKLGKALKKAGFKNMGQAKQAARARRAQKKLDKLSPKYRKKLMDPRRRDLLLDNADVLVQLMGMKDALLAGTLQPQVAIRQAKALGGSVDPFDKLWVDVVIEAAEMMAEWVKIERRRPKGLHLRGKRGQQYFITRSARGDAPASRPWQLSHGDDVQRRDGPGKVFMPFGHDYHSSVRDAFIAAWDDGGPLQVLDIAESLAEAAGWGAVEERALTDIPGVKRIVDTSKLRDGDDVFGNAAVAKNGYLLGWHVTDDPSTVSDILRKRVPVQKAGGKSGDMGAGFYLSAVPRMWVNRSGGKWDFLDRLSASELAALTDKLQAVIVGDRRLSDNEKRYAVRDIGHVRAGRISADYLSRFGGMPYGIPFWQEDWLKTLGITPAAKPVAIRISARGRFAQMTQSSYTLQAARLLKRAGVVGAFVRGGMSDTAQLVIWDPQAITQIGAPEVVESRQAKLKLTYTDRGAHLSNKQGHVTHKLLKPGYGFGNEWTLYAVTGPYSMRLVGTFDSPEAARDAAQMVESKQEEPLEEVYGDWLFHTTGMRRGIDSLIEIAKSQELRPEEGYVSFSEAGPRTFMGEFVLVFRKRTIAPQLTKVQYTEAWARANPGKASYVTGNWRGRDEDFEEWLHDVVSSFHDLNHEREWISKTRNTRFPFSSGALVAVLCRDGYEVRKVRKIMADLLPPQYVLPFRQGIKLIRDRQAIAPLPRGAREAHPMTLVGEGTESLDEQIASQARTSFDSAPYANMRLLDVARLLDGATKQRRPNVKLIEKLVDRLVHALEFTIYSIQGRPEGKRIGDLIRGSFNNLSDRLPELALRERRQAMAITATLSESLDDLELGPPHPSAQPLDEVFDNPFPYEWKGGHQISHDDKMSAYMGTFEDGVRTYRVSFFVSVEAVGRVGGVRSAHTAHWELHFESRDAAAMGAWEQGITGTAGERVFRVYATLGEMIHDVHRKEQRKGRTPSSWTLWAKAEETTRARAYAVMAKRLARSFGAGWAVGEVEDRASTGNSLVGVKAYSRSGNPYVSRFGHASQVEPEKVVPA